MASERRAVAPPAAQAASVQLRVGPARLRARASATPAGLLAAGGLVSSVLLSTAALVWVSASAQARAARRRG